MRDDFVYSFGLAFCLGMGHRCEPSLTLQGAEVISDLCHVELSPIVEDHYSRDVNAGDDIFPDKLRDFSRDDRSNDLSLHPFYEVIHRNKQVLSLTHGFGEGSQYVHPPGGER